MMLINSSFHTRNNLSENIPQFGHAPSELFASLILGRKSIKNIGLKGSELLICPGRPHVLGRPWLCGVGWYLFTDVSGQPKGNCSALETWDGWTVSQFGNQLTNYVAQRSRRQNSDIARLLPSAWIAVIFDNLSAVQVAKNSPYFLRTARYWPSPDTWI